MNKTDKFLYGGFAVVIIGGITAMLVTVFSPPKQPAKETAEPPTPQIDEPPTVETAALIDEPPIEEYPYFYFDENGNKVFLTQEQLDAGTPREQELRREEAERLAKEKAEKEWWESRQEWVERFPFEPTHHPEITLDTAVYDPNGGESWPEEKKDKAYWEMRERVQNHSFLRRFYESKLRYTKEFEQLYDIVHEEAGEKADNPIILGKAFNALKEYHQANAQDPKSLYRENARVALPPQPPPRLPSILAGLTPQQIEVYKALPPSEKSAMTAELRYRLRKEFGEKLRAYHARPQYEIRDVTWGERTESRKEIIMGNLCSHVQPDQPDQPWMSQEQASRIRDRLINEISAEGFLEMGGAILNASVHRYELELKAGDPLLIK